MHVFSGRDAISTRTGVMGVLSIGFKFRLLIATKADQAPTSLLHDDGNLGDSATTPKIEESSKCRERCPGCSIYVGRPFPPPRLSAELVD